MVKIWPFIFIISGLVLSLQGLIKNSYFRKVFQKRSNPNTVQRTLSNWKFCATATDVNNCFCHLSCLAISLGNIVPVNSEFS